MITYIIFFISLWIHGGRSQCKKENPFYMIDKGCANFNDVCVRKDYNPCKSLLQACAQCPASNLTESTLLNMMTILRNQRGKSTNEFKKLENSSFTMIILIVISFVVILVFLIEMRFQIFKRCCRKRENVRKHRINNDEKRALIPTDQVTQFINQSQTSIQNTMMETLSGARAPAEKDAPTNNLNPRFGEAIHQKLENIENEIKTIRKTLSVTASINMRGFTNPIKIQINREDNVVKIKHKICAQMMNTKSNHCKTMVLKLNGNPLDDNQYLVDEICSVDSLYCDVIENLDPNKIVVVMLRGNICLPEMIQIKKSQTIEELKSVLSQLTGVADESLKLFRDLSEVDKLDDLKDYESLRVIQMHTGEVTIESIFDHISPVTLSYSNVESIENIKKKIADSLGSPADDIILFWDNKNLNDDIFLFEIDIEQLKLCHLIPAIKLDNIKYMMPGDLSEISEGRHPWTREEVVLKKYQLEPMKILIENKVFLNELITFQITKSHEGFVPLNGVFKENDYFYIMMEKMEGSIKPYITKDSLLPEEIIVQWSKQILSALKYLHDHFIIHRNIKPSSILLDKGGNIKLSSFGVAKYVRCGDKEYLMEGFKQSQLGICRYMAPEVCNDEIYGAKVDVWSFGATMIEMATGMQIFDGMGEGKIIMEIGKEKRIPFKLDETRSPEIKEFIDQCLKADPKIRPTVDDLLNHVFLGPK